MNRRPAARSSRLLPPDPLAAALVNRVVKHARKPLPPHLPRETHEVSPKQKACPNCSGERKAFGEDVSEMLEWVMQSSVSVWSELCGRSVNN